jgi:hypothetical protein
MKNDFKIGLNEDQKNVFEALEKFCLKENVDQLFCIQGYAGTGKTYTLTRFFSYLKSESSDVKIVMSAPTNKAVGVLKNHTPKDFSSSIEFETIHKLLGVKPEITIDGDEIFIQKTPPLINKYDFLVVDEVSMLDDELFHSILKSIKDTKTKVIFMGDPKQIPPINKTDCEPFLNPDMYGIKTMSLSQIMRQADGNMIIEASHYIRDNIELRELGIEKFNKQGQFEIYNISNTDDRMNLKTSFERDFGSDLFKSNIEEFKVISWRNDKVNHYNQYIRGIIHNGIPSQLPQLIEGELLICNGPVIDRLADGKLKGMKKFVLNNNTEVKVVKFHSASHAFDVPKSEKSKKKEKKEVIEYYLTQVTYFDFATEKEISVEIRIIKDEFKEVLSGLLKKWANKAKKSDISVRKGLWNVFYDIKEFFAPVSYAYSITAHRSQGSTYKNVYIDISDISLNNKIVERNRIIYTAVTRASVCSKIILK